MADIKSMELAQLEAYVTDELGEKKFRAAQMYEWMHSKMADSCMDMTNLPAAMRERLSAESPLRNVKILKRYVSGIDGTRKYLFQLQDGLAIESVLMKYQHGNSVCISSQAGCRMGCSFCASAIGGLERNLTASEMLSQIYQIAKDTGERVSHVVVMGTGEPLDNYDQLVSMLRIISSEKGQHISQRNLTVSTCGIVPRIYELADLQMAVTLAISLHASDDATRQELMPVAKKWTISQILDACRYYADRTGRRVTFEYSLIHGKNDSPEHAQRLGILLSDMGCHVNLIPVNPVRETGYVQPDRIRITKFKTILEKYVRNVTIRREMGRDIQAACGQLRKEYKAAVGKDR